MAPDPSYLPLAYLLALVDGENGVRVRALYADLLRAHPAAPGSSHNHQAWPGGYWDHVAEVLNVARVLYGTLSACRPLPFSLSDALLVLAAHDLEKPARYPGVDRGDLESKASRAAYRLDLLEFYGVRLTPEQANALRYAEGVRDGEYTAGRRMMGPLAAFVHACDLLSARLWFDHPLGADDPWAGAVRSNPSARGVTVAEEPLSADGTVDLPE